jgi:hypothetical protein
MQVIQSVGHVTGDSGFRTLSDESPTLTGAERYLGLVTAQTAARSTTLLASASFAPDTGITFADLIGGVTSANTFTISVATGDSVNGVVNGTVVLNAAFQQAVFRTDGAGHWTAVVSSVATPGGAAAPFAKYSTNATSTPAPGDMSGASMVYVLYSAATAITTRTAAQLIADSHLSVGQIYVLRVINTDGATLTITGGTGVTITGTATLATNTTRDFLVTVNSPTAIGFQDVGAGTAP